MCCRCERAWSRRELLRPRSRQAALCRCSSRPLFSTGARALTAVWGTAMPSPAASPESASSGAVRRRAFPRASLERPSGAHAGAQRLTRCACTLARARACSPCGRACPHSIQHENKAHVAIDADASRPAGEPAQRPASARPLTLVDRLMQTLLSRHEPPKGVANAAGAERAAYLGHAPRSLLLGVSPTAPRVGLTEAS